MAPKFISISEPYDDHDKVHFQVLLTIYKQLTGNTVDCPRFGSHWEQIGFQVNKSALWFNFI